MMLIGVTMVFGALVVEGDQSLWLSLPGVVIALVFTKAYLTSTE